jgi:2-iminobutanoate/2-iminopropanoate deaminase
VGPYSPSIVWDKLVFVSGQGPLDPGSGKPVDGDIAAQTARALANIEALLKEAGSSREKVLKVNVYLAHIEDFGAMNAVYQGFFGSAPYPARTTIQAGALPGGIGVEIDVIAYRSEGR